MGKIIAICVLIAVLAFLGVWYLTWRWRRQFELRWGLPARQLKEQTQLLDEAHALISGLTTIQNLDKINYLTEETARARQEWLDRARKHKRERGKREAF